MTKEEQFIKDYVNTGMFSIFRHGNILRNREFRGNKRKTVDVKSRDATHKLAGGYRGVEVVTIRYRAHRIVWTYFNGPIPKGLEINHKNGIKNDNRPDNLEIVTSSENAIHACRVLGVRRGSNQYLAKLTDEIVTKARVLYASGRFTIQDLADNYGVGASTIRDAIKRKTWKHVGDPQ